MQIEAIQMVLAALQPPAIFIDNESRIVVCNTAAKALLGAGAQGRHYVSILRQPMILDAIEAVMRGGAPMRANFIGSEGGRETLWIASAAPLSAEGVVGILVSFEDTTAMHEAGQMRRDFVANVSHELRTPLTALIGFIETLRGAARDDPAARDRFLTIMAREATRMNRLVQDLLSLSRVESEERMRPTGRVNPGDLLRSVVMSMAPLVEERGVTLALSGAEGLPEIVGDADQLRQVFNNLIENAVKYGGDGKMVTLSAHLIEREPSMRASAVQIDVHDQGEGIDPLHIPRLTERFYRVDNHRSREMGGTGLGLAIVKHIVSRHRGRLRITSTAGRGSIFSVLLPLV